MHPFMPFITEGLFQTLNEMAPKRGLKGLIEADYREVLAVSDWKVSGLEQFADTEVNKQIEQLQAIIKCIREIRSAHNIAPSRKLAVAISASQGAIGSLEGNISLISSLGGVEKLQLAQEITRDKTTASSLVGEFEVFVYDVIDEQAERNRLEKQKEAILGAIKPIEGKLANENYVTRAKPEVVQSSRERLAELKEQLKVVEKLIEQL